MANDPLFINASTGAPAYSANELRQAMALALMYGGRNMGARQGVRPGGNQLQVSIAGSTITTQPGVAYVDPGLTVPQGGYWVAISPADTQTLTAAHATFARKDIIILRVYDNDEDSSGQRKAQVEYLAGVASGSPVEPAVPAGSFRLATIDVPASGGGSPVVTNNAPFAIGAGGILPVASLTERNAITGAHEGQAVWRSDRDWIETQITAPTGTTWRVVTVPLVTSTGDMANVPNPVAGQFVSNTGDSGLYRYNGSAWRPMPALIAENILGGTAASVNFPGIPSTYRSLRLEIVCRSDVAALATNLLVQFNGDTGANYDVQEVGAQISTPAGAELLGQTAINIKELTGASVAANHPGIFTIDIPWYSAGTFMKLVNAESTWSNGTASGSLVTRSISGRWRSNAAITSILLKPAAGLFIAGSSFSLIGLP